MNTARVIQLPNRNPEPEPETLAPLRNEAAGREAYAQVLWAGGELEAAIGVWREALQRDPRLTSARLALSRAHRILGQWDEAVRELSLCLPLIPDQPDILAELACCCQHSQSSSHALVLLDQALRLDPDHRLARAARARMTAQVVPITREQASSEVLDWPEALATPPGPDVVVERLFEEACLAMKHARSSEARARLEELILLEPDEFRALFELAQLEENDHRRPWAIRYYEAALHSRPQSWEAAYNLARLYVEMGQDGRARVLVERALLLEPESGRASWLLAQLCDRAGETGEARFWLERTAKLDPANADAFLRLGHLALQAGQLGQAAECMERAYEADPGRYDTAYNLGLVRWRMGESAQARELWRKARALNPGGEEAARALAGLDRNPG